VAACPTGALARRKEKIVLDPSLCTGCGACVQACTLLFWDEERLQPLICDLCGECIRRCPEKAIRFKKRE